MSKKKRAKLAKRNAAYGYANGAQGGAFANAPGNGGLLNGLQSLLGTRRSERFLTGALLGAAAVYVLSDEKLRGTIIKAGVSLFSGIAGGFEEMKEQIADIRAEMQAGEHTAS